MIGPGSSSELMCRRIVTGCAAAVNRINFLEVKMRSEEHTSELQSRQYLVCRLLLEKKKNKLFTLRPIPVAFTAICSTASFPSVPCKESSQSVSIYIATVTI